MHGYIKHYGTEAGREVGGERVLARDGKGLHPANPY